MSSVMKVNRDSFVKYCNDSMTSAAEHCKSVVSIYRYEPFELNSCKKIFKDMIYEIHDTKMNVLEEIDGIIETQSDDIESLCKIVERIATATSKIVNMWSDITDWECNQERIASNAEACSSSCYCHYCLQNQW